MCPSANLRLLGHASVIEELEPSISTDSLATGEQTGEDEPEVLAQCRRPQAEPWATGGSGVTLQPEARLDCQVRNANKQTAFRCCVTPTRPLCELQMDAPSPELYFMNELGDVRGLKCSRAFSAFCIFERAI